MPSVLIPGKLGQGIKANLIIQDFFLTRWSASTPWKRNPVRDWWYQTHSRGWID